MPETHHFCFTTWARKGRGFLLATAFCLLSVAVSGNSARAADSSSRPDYHQERLDWLQNHAASGQSQPLQQWNNNSFPPDALQIDYVSDGLPLKAWIRPPAGYTKAALQDPASNFPALIYGHGGFAAGGGDFNDVDVFRQAGFAVMIPALRNENGNPGATSWFTGEISDFLAATDRLAAFPGVNGDRIVAFGHSIGAGVTLMAAMDLEKDRFLLLGGSGGIYPVRHMEKMFERSFDGDAARPRDIYRFAHSVSAPYIAYTGREDSTMKAYRHFFRKRASPSPDISFITSPGNHFTSLAPAVADFLDKSRKAIAEGK